MKEWINKIIFLISDYIILLISLHIAFFLRKNIVSLPYYGSTNINIYTEFYLLYIIPLGIFMYEGLYTNRYDFWHELKLLGKGIIFSLIFIFAYLAISKSIEDYSRLIIGLMFLIAMVLLPFEKILIKYILYKTKLWQKKIILEKNNYYLNKEIKNNFYLGYFPVYNNENVDIIFINADHKNYNDLIKKINKEYFKRKEIIFIPYINQYDLTNAVIYQYFNTTDNLIVFKNRLNSKSRKVLRCIFNYLLAILLLPFILILIIIFSIFIKLESKGPVFFVHYRIGKNGKKIPVYKFRTMYHDAEERLNNLLKKNKDIKKEWEKSFKLKNDPRVTRIGKFLRRTSLDELPQIFNILKGEMYFVGPRPVTQEELDRYYGDNKKYYYMVKPGITGLWQVSGRSDLDYNSRVVLDKWYVVNWSLWLDIVILFKTIKVVLLGKGAY